MGSSKHHGKPAGLEEWWPGIEIQRRYGTNPEEDIGEPEKDERPRPAWDEAAIGEGSKENGKAGVVQYRR